ncbi:MAG TPA: type VII secretion integral membrane protein EccD [Mycobacterium sp.]
MTGVRELDHVPAKSAAPEHIRVSVVGGRTQLDVALPVDVPVASLVPELVRLVRSRDVEEPSDTPWPETPHKFWVLGRLDAAAPLQPNETLRSAGVVDGELLQLTDERALTAPTLYDDVVDAAARLNKAAYAGWNAAAAQWMSFAGLAIASLIWAYLVVVTTGTQRALVVGSAVVVAVALVGVAALAYRSYRRADVGAAVGWSTIPIGAAIVWALARGFGNYGVAAGCASMVALLAAVCWAIGTGHWGYLSSAVLFAGGALAILAHALGVSAQTAGATLAVVGAFACLTVSRLTGRLARVEPSSGGPDADREAVMFETPFAPQPVAADAAGKTSSAAPSSKAMPTAEAVWARVRAAAVTGSALYAGLAVTVLCGVAAVLRAAPRADWAALVLAGICAAALGVHARVPDSALERVSLSVPAALLVFVGCVNAQRGGTAMAWAGFGALLAIAVLASLTGLRVAGRNPPRRWATGWAYLQYVAYAALIPVALWATGGYAGLGI